MVRSGQDDEACRILWAAARLHAPRSKPLPELIPLVCWFRDLEPAAAKYGGIPVRRAETACTLPAEPREVGVLHGDLHHGDVLDFGARGWLAIDPKRLVEAAGLERRRLLPWILVWTGLSASWILGDDDPLASIDLRIAELAAAELDR
jgi:streptomycin 6-kinase